MAMLKNAKREAFAQALARGESAGKAYVTAGYSEHASNAANLAKHEQILTRIGELLARRDEIERKATERAADRLSITKERVLAELAKIGFSDIRNVVSWGEGIAVVDESGQQAIANGVSLISSTKISDETAGAIAEVKQTKEGLVVKMYDKKGALVDLGKHLGMFIERHEHGGVGDFAAMTEDELLNEDERLSEAIAAYVHDGSDAEN